MMNNSHSSREKLLHIEKEHKNSKQVSSDDDFVLMMYLILGAE